MRASSEDGVALRNSAQRQSFAGASPNGFSEMSPDGIRKRIARQIPTVEEESDGFTLQLTEVQTKENTNASPNKRRWRAQAPQPQVLMSSIRLPHGG